MNARHFFGITFSAALLVLAGCDPGGSGGEGGGGAGGGTTTTSGGGGAGGATGGSGGATGGATTGGSGGSTGTLHWYTTCGDPVCGMPTADPNLVDCTGQVEGDPCSTDGDLCEIANDDCNTNMICAASDPKDDPNGCPISLASKKHDIEYITDRDRDRIREDLMTMPLATWKYNTESRGEKEHLGFIIDDQPASSPALRPTGERVDLYGYTSMAVAALQAQNKEIQSLRAELDSLRAELRARPDSAACSSSSR